MPTPAPKLEIYEKHQLIIDIVQYLSYRDTIWSAKAGRATSMSLLKAIWIDVKVREIESGYPGPSPRVEAQLKKVPSIWERVKWYFDWDQHGYQTSSVCRHYL